MALDRSKQARSESGSKKHERTLEIGAIVSGDTKVKAGNESIGIIPLV